MDKRKALERIKAEAEKSKLSVCGISTAQTGTIYIEIENLKIRISNHAQAYPGVAYTVDGQEGTVKGCIDFLRAIASGEIDPAELNKELMQEKSDVEKEWNEANKIDDPAAFIRKYQAIQERLERRSHEGGPSGDHRRQLRCQLRRMKEQAELNGVTL